MYCLCILVYLAFTKERIPEMEVEVTVERLGYLRQKLSNSGKDRIPETEVEVTVERIGEPG